MGDFFGFAVTAHGDAGQHHGQPFRVVAAGPGHFRGDWAGVNRVDADSVRGVLEGGGFGQDADAAFGRLIGGSVVGHGDDAQLGRNVDYRTAARFAHGRDRRPDSQEDAFEVHVDGLIPKLNRLIVDGERVAADAGVVDQHVEFAMP